MKITNLEKDFVQLSVDIGNSMGLDELGSEIIGLLYIEPEPVSMEDIAKKTGYSTTSIYNKLELLSRFHCVNKIKKPGSKKVFFCIEKDIFAMFIDFMKEGYEKKIVPLKNNIPLIIEKYKNSDLSEDDKKRLKIISEYHSRIIKIEKVMKNIIEGFEH